MQIGNKIKRMRIERGLTQEELANRCELSKGFISQVENDLTSPSIATLIDILEILGTNLKEFFSDDKDEKITYTYEDMFETENSDLKYKFSRLPIYIISSTIRCRPLSPKFKPLNLLNAICTNSSSLLTKSKTQSHIL